MNPVEEYFSRHKTQLWIFKHGMAVIAPSVLAFLILLVSTHAVDWSWAAAALIVLNWLSDRAKALDPNVYWEGVGAGKKRRK
jgi:hypothetical protein